jgi:hypothetical protein
VLVGRSGLRAVVIAGIELSVVDPQLAAQQIELLDTGMSVRRVVLHHV